MKNSSKFAEKKKKTIINLSVTIILSKEKKKKKKFRRKQRRGLSGDEICIQSRVEKIKVKISGLI